ncbi:MAG: hypothetical protein M5R36_19895 [Deltaproteobacteria bacterium]|nr:hypothetical protein [Deltaproteobacteria bacterium]
MMTPRRAMIVLCAAVFVLSLFAACSEEGEKDETEEEASSEDGATFEEPQCAGNHAPQLLGPYLVKNGAEVDAGTVFEPYGNRRRRGRFSGRGL